MHPRSRFKILRRAGNVYLFFMGIVILALAGEIACRLLLARKVAGAEAFRVRHPHAYDARTLMEAWTDSLWAQPWEEYKKSARAVMSVGDQEYVVETNSLGYRTREFSPRKASGVVRVICIGGSTTVQGQTNATTYPALLEAMLRERHPSWSVEVLNLGISGVQSEYWPRKRYSFLDFEPDVVVQYEGVNDLLHTHMRRWARDHPYVAALYRSVLFASLAPYPHHQFDEHIRGTVENMVGVTTASAKAGAAHVVGTFAAPDISRASAEVRRYLEVNLMEQWGSRRSPLYSYTSYYALLQYFNEALASHASSGYRIAPVAERLKEPDRFVDICHMTRSGIRDLAAAFLPEVEQAIGDRLKAQAAENGKPVRGGDQ